MYVYVDMYKHFLLLHCSQNAIIAKIHIFHDSKELLYDQAIVSLYSNCLRMEDKGLLQV